MEELQRLKTSRRGYRAHTTKLLTGIAELTSDTTDTPAEELTFTIEQLERKHTILEDLDARIAPLITNETDLETEIIESEDTRTKILTGLVRLRLKLSSCARTEATESRTAVSIASDPVPTTATETTRTLPEPIVSSTIATSIPVSPITSRTPHTRVDVHPTLETATRGPTYSAADATRTTEHTTVTSSASYATSRLPKLSIPTFTGDPLTCQSFWDCFDSAVNSNPMLSDVQKLSYLRAQLEGDASRVIAGFPLTNASYGQSVALLKDRFGQPFKIVNAHLQALLHLPNPSNTLSSLQLFHDSVEGHIRSLTSLGKPVESYGDLLVPVILEKLPSEARKHLARECTNSDWTLQELQDAIFKEIRVFESGLQTIPQSSRTPTASFYAGTRRIPTESVTGDVTKKKNCTFCKGPHAPSTCNVITEPSKRLEIVRQQNLCFNCLAHHKVSQCNSKYRCRKCSRKHHTSLCTHKSDTTPQGNNSANHNRNSTLGSNNTMTTTTMTTIASNATTSLHVAGDNVCLLKTAVANVYANDTGIEATILLDEGSQRSFLTEGLATNLKVQTDHTEDICLASFGSPTTLVKRLDVGTIYLETITGERLPLSVLIVPTIAAPIHNTTDYTINRLPYLKGLQLAHPITVGEQFEVTLLIGADHYWKIVESQRTRSNSSQVKTGLPAIRPISTID